MGQVRHGSATTTHAVRAAVQRLRASLATPSRDLTINPKTVAKWRKRLTVEGLKVPHSQPCPKPRRHAKRQRFKRHPIGFFHIDIAEVQTAEGKLYLFVGIDHTSKVAIAQPVDKAGRRTAWEFVEHLLKAAP